MLVYCSNYRIICFAWMPLEYCMLPCWSCSDGEENVGDQEYFDDQQDQQEFANQGKYSMGSTLIPIHLY